MGSTLQVGKLGVATFLLAALLLCNVAHADPVRDKLTRTADLTTQQADELMALYAELYIKVHTLRHRQKGTQRPNTGCCCKPHIGNIATHPSNICIQISIANG